MSHISSRINAVLAAHTAPTVNPVAVRPFDANHALVIFETAASENASFSGYEQALQGLYGQRFHLLAGSMFEFEHPQSQVPLMRVVARKNAATVDYVPETQLGKTLVSANVFRDDEDGTLWKLVESDGKKVLVQNANDDFAAIFQSRSSRRSVVAHTADTVVNYNEGDYVLYFDVKAQALDFGFLAHKPDGQYVLSRSAGEYRRILPDQILEAAFFQAPQTTVGRTTLTMPAFRRAEMVLAGDHSWSAYTDYMRTLYGNTEFFSALEKIIRERGRA